MAGGRPTKYTEELLAVARAYPDNYNTEYGHKIPSIVGLCRVLKIHSDTVYDWIRHPEKKEFSGIVKEILDSQHFKLMDGGLSGEFNSSIAKLILAKHGHSDKQDITQETTATVKHEVSASDKFAEILKDYSKD